jgi:hypothetical protein
MKPSDADNDALALFEGTFGRYMETIKHAQQFKLGDFLILKMGTAGTNSIVYKNSYGAPIKYKVVCINKHDIAFVKRINSAGEPVGKMSSCVGMITDDYYKDSNTTFAFELDPDFADALILQDNYDPASLHKSKKDIWKAVTEHNKACKVPTQDMKDVVAFFNSVNVGDTLWTSSVGFYFVQDKKAMTISDFDKKFRFGLRTYVKGPNVVVLTVRDKNGKIKDITADFFSWKALYKERPRTYKELNI